MEVKTEEPPKQPEAETCRTCADYDEDCEDLPDKLGCWMYDPGRGMCPYLRARKGAE